MDYAEFYRDRLYPIQDKVLNIITQVAPDFYLTGGTVLSRFYLQHRYSEDLDLFVNRHKRFKELVKAIASALGEEFQKTRIQLSDLDFMRLFVYEKDTELKIELVNDVGYHFLETERKNELQLDNWQNILSNKICALSRNATKDYADILFLALKYTFNWVNIYNAAKLKDTWVNENHFHIIAKDILIATDNSLCEKDIETDQ